MGKALAFDAWKGRLWAVCPRCTRWNLAPIEERWEAVESAEKQFTDARLRVQSENIGLAKLRDGTRLIRVGQALPGELAAWRYGNQLLRRRRKYLLATGAVGIVAVAWSGLALAGVLGGAGALGGIGNILYQHRVGKRLVHQLPADESPTGSPLLLRRFQLSGARVTTGEDGDIALHLPNALESTREKLENGRTVWLPVRSIALEGRTARTVLGRAMVDAISGGASRSDLKHAVELLAKLGSAEEYLRFAGKRNTGLGIPHVPNFNSRVSWQQFAGTFRGERVPPPTELRAPWCMNKGRQLARPEALALEMALHEESERRALEGELAALEAAWREAEEIAHIADYLPDEPPEA